MKIPRLNGRIGLAFAFLASVAISQGAVTLSTDGTYDPTAQTNAVDTDATGTLAAFKTSVSTAFTAGFGGVAHMDAAFTSDTAFDLTYASLAKTLRITSSVPQVSATVGGSSSFFPISGNTVMNPGTPSDFDFTFTAPVGEGVTSFALTLVERNNYAAGGASFTVSATFSDGTTASATSVIGDIDPAISARGTDDTFWSFTAPDGHSITKISIDGTSGSPPLIDDIAFITTAGVIIPEPSSLLLIAATAGAGLLRRRRN